MAKIKRKSENYATLLIYNDTIDSISNEHEYKIDVGSNVRGFRICGKRPNKVKLIDVGQDYILTPEHKEWLYNEFRHIFDEDVFFDEVGSLGSVMLKDANMPREGAKKLLTSKIIED